MNEELINELDKRIDITKNTLESDIGLKDKFNLQNQLITMGIIKELYNLEVIKNDK